MVAADRYRYPLHIFHLPILKPRTFEEFLVVAEGEIVRVSDYRS